MAKVKSWECIHFALAFLKKKVFPIGNSISYRANAIMGSQSLGINLRYFYEKT